MSIAVVFPGQGSQFLGMADAWTGHDAGRTTLEEVSTAIERDVVEGCRDEDALATTEFVQPALLACGVAAFRVLRAEGVTFVGAAGHSLGEFSALVAAEVVGLGDALAMVAVRGRAMQAAGEARPGTMSALLGVGAEQAEELCDVARGADVLLVANENSPQQVVISGSVPAIERAETLVAALHEDRDNMLLVVTARVMNPEIRIITKCVDIEKEPMFRRGGANGVVSPNRTGGLRVASQILRPNVVEFLDQMLRQEGEPLRFNEIRVEEGSPLVGRSLHTSGISDRTGVRIVAGYDPATGRYEYNLPGSWTIQRGTVLVFIGDAAQVEGLRRMAEA